MVDHFKQTASTDEEIHRRALQEEAELARSSRAYTLLDRDRAQILRCGGEAKLARHKKVLEILKNERKSILIDLTVASRKEKVVEDNKGQQRLAKLLTIYDTYGNTIKRESQELREIKYQIDVTKKKFVQLATKQISDQQILDRRLKAEKTLEKLENKLEVQVRKFCAIGAENFKLREKLEDLLIERSRFNKFWNDMIRKLQIGKGIMMDLIEQATIAYDQREDWVMKLQLLRGKAFADYTQHLNTMRDYQRQIAYENQLAEYFSVKNQRRNMVDLARIHQDRRDKQKQKTDERLNYLNKILADIKEDTQKDDIVEIAKFFVLQEEQNFSDFKYVNEMNSEMERLSDNLFALHEGIEKQQCSLQKWKQEQGHTLEMLKKDVLDEASKADEQLSQLSEVNRRLDVIINGVNSLFRLFNCDDDPIIQILGNHGTIHYHNVLLYLQIIEENIREALVTKYRHERPMQLAKFKGEYLIRHGKRQVLLLPLQTFCSTNPCPLCIEHEMVSDLVDELQFAYTREEIKKKLKDRVALERINEIVHNVSACHLPKSRAIIQQRYQ